MKVNALIQSRIRQSRFEAIYTVIHTAVSVPKRALPAQGPSEAQVRQQLGTALVPPWEKQP